MYKIGTFSIMTGITVKALRYYHDEGILIPKEVDVLTGYRLYSNEQVELANMIKLLRNCDFSVREIKSILLECDDLNDIPFYLDEKVDIIDSEIQRLLEVKKCIDIEKEKRKVVKVINEYQVIKKTLDTTKVIATRYKGKYEDCGAYIGSLYKYARGSAKDVPFNLYYDGEHKEEADIEVCIPVKKELNSKGDIIYRQVEGIDGISVIHIGPYDTIGSAYQALADYANEHNLEMQIPSREIYRKGPGMLFKGNPNKYVTEVFVPIK